MDTHEIICGHFEDVLLAKKGLFQCLFCDPPDNIGLQYGSHDDSMDDRKYRLFLDDLVWHCVNASQVAWISFNAKWTLAMAAAVRNRLPPDWEFKPCVQAFTFGQYNPRDLCNNHRPLWRLKHRYAPLYPEHVKVPSWRQENGDKRAAAGGRVPGDVAEFERIRKDTLPVPPLSLSDINRLLKKIEIRGDEDCWEWTANKRGGYGRMRVGGHLYGATRLVWKLANGYDPVGQVILHRCDNPGCCNPAHLLSGTDGENNSDKEIKGRAKHPRGEGNGLAKLTEAQVLDIFHSPLTNRSLAAKYSVSDVAISCIKLGKTWGHVTGLTNADDVFRFPRVTGNSKQRRRWCPTQLHEGLVERCVLLSTRAGDSVCDPFGGTGTTLRVCKRLGRPSTTIELDPTYCMEIAKDNEVEWSDPRFQVTARG